MLLEGVILKCNTSIQTNRSCASIYNIIMGSRSIQTVLDVHLYHLKNMYSIYSSLQKNDFDAYINQLIHSGFLIPIDENKIQITIKGEEYLQTCEEATPLHYFDGITYLGVSGPFMERLLLTIQTFTNIQVKNNHFIPVVDKPPIYSWIKQFYHIHKTEIEYILTGLYDEMSRLLNTVTEKEACIFVDRLTGYNHYGHSMYQLHKKYGLKMEDVPLYLEGIIHKILNEIFKNGESYPTLKEFVVDLHRSTFLTASAKHTYNLYQRGLPATEIATIRKLKVNTIYDHLVEIALYDPDFPLQVYVNQTKATIILQAIKQAGSYKLKDIKALIDSDITYFQIRLVMAVMRNSLKGVKNGVTTFKK